MNTRRNPNPRAEVNCSSHMTVLRQVEFKTKFNLLKCRMWMEASVPFQLILVETHWEKPKRYSFSGVRCASCRILKEFVGILYGIFYIGDIGFLWILDGFLRWRNVEPSNVNLTMSHPYDYQLTLYLIRIFHSSSFGLQRKRFKNVAHIISRWRGT